MGIEAALFGSSVFGPATAASVAAAGSTSAALAGMTTGGLLGSLGSLSTGLSIFSGLSSIVGGFQQQSAANDQAQAALATANLQGKEAARSSFKEAQFVKQEAESLRRKQKVAYLASGVSLEGSPLLVMEETRTKGAANAAEILASGAAAGNAAAIEGRVRANQLKASGREAFASGITSGLKTIASGF